VLVPKIPRITEWLSIEESKGRMCVSVAVPEFVSIDFASNTSRAYLKERR
jgi:hypothetical protein